MVMVSNNFGSINILYKLPYMMTIKDIYVYIDISNLEHYTSHRYNVSRRVATCTQKRSCVHIEIFYKNENMVNLGHKVE